MSCMSCIDVRAVNTRTKHKAIMAGKESVKQLIIYMDDLSFESASLAEVAFWFLKAKN